MDIRFKYFLFDWDGCLVDTLPIWFEGMREGLAILILMRQIILLRMVFKDGMFSPN